MQSNRYWCLRGASCLHRQGRNIDSLRCKNAALTSRFIWTHYWFITHNVKLSLASSNNFIPGSMRLNYVFEVRSSYVCVTSRFSRCVSYCYGLWTVHPPPTFGLPSHSVPIISSWERRSMICATVRTQSCRNEGITDFVTIIVAQPFQKFPALYGTQMFSTVFRRTHHWTLPWLMNRIFKLAQYFKIHLNIFFLWYGMIYLLTAIGLSPGGSSTVHIYTQTIHRTIRNKQYIEQHNNFGRVRGVLHLG